MEAFNRLWLVTNSQSGSNNDAVVAHLRDQLAGHGLVTDRHLQFPDDGLPTPDQLDAAGICLVAVFAGDGTLNAALDRLAGWSGAVLVLPGGTMNLLHRRLHGEVDTAAVLAALSAGRAVRRRPPIIRCAAGKAYAGLLAGPGTAWNRVREAMRGNAVLDMAEGTINAIAATLGEAGVASVEPHMGREEGYPLLMLDPEAEAIAVTAFHAQTPAEYLAQAFALLRRNFREGPHEALGGAARLRLASSDGQPFGLLLDGEPAEIASPATFELVPCEVDLLATFANG